MRILLLTIFALFCVSCNSQSNGTDSGETHVFEPVIKTYNYKLGASTIVVSTYQYGSRRQPVIICLHDDETTGFEAARKVLGMKGGFLVRIQNNEERLISFYSGGKRYKFDPNRMFSKAGLANNLRRLNPRASNRITDRIFLFGRFVLGLVPPETGVVIAMHNNDEGRLTVNSYQQGSEYGKDALSVHENKNMDPDNFFLVTDIQLYKRLQLLDYNVVMQHNSLARDDGSLSVYFGRRNKSYTNIEAQLGRIQEQTEMLTQLLAELSGN